MIDHRAVGRGVRNPLTLALSWGERGGIILLRFLFNAP
jgi:hypothetical protein